MNVKEDEGKKEQDKAENLPSSQGIAVVTAAPAPVERMI